jgi:anti-anti-sigma regulatory factor
MVLDAVGLVFCDGSGITILIRARNRVVEEQAWLRLARVRPSLRQVLGIVDLSGVLPVFDTVTGAIEGQAPCTQGPGASR